MQLYKINEDLTVSTEAWSNFRAWGHEVRAFYKGREVEKNNIRYFNRTWERYTYETALLGLVDKLDKKNKVPLKDRLLLYKTIKNSQVDFTRLPN
jgi:hypothetical protein